ncbi:MAG: HD domain-containing protein [Planctomycetota bacterium]|nr:HD domain-containing protein [Planctomycetota bacterium]
MKITELIKEFGLIEEEDLRERCISVWERALKEHRIKAEDLKKNSFCSDVPFDVVNLVAHIRAVAQTAAHLADTYEHLYGVKVKKDVLLAGALLHDVGKLDERENPLLEHSLSSVLRAKDAGIKEDVLHTIAFHSETSAAKRRSVEAELLYFADFVHYRPLLRLEEKQKKS